jgi:hypothetical protein
MGMSFHLDLGFAFPTLTLPLVVSGVTVSMIEARRVIGEAQASQETAMGLEPVLLAGRDGLSLGIAGVF